MKIAVDTNILVRIITGDNADLTAMAHKLIEQHGSKEIFVAYGVLLEVFFVLTKLYDLSQEVACAAIHDLMKIDQLSFEHEIAIRLALAKCKQGYSFADILFGEIASQKHLKMYTFDKGLKNNKSFEVI